ncbi:uncharacterized protein Nmag_2773 [Natrialba magadii ATCC 43099]|uniref:Alpha/beta hydrolase fold protein n=1 Tax=Natrialba magadii (strain ATCC 43099 / DSM 3394 / CCM 3739 / CIP 104546 / IAM 13178 / JCM 8861 / NBRC 102185 / NCIMB 2190 / MS3) TaxID=547559 RepID=D3SZR8_NATMM|nr:hypothetical protein [Natrialba magadii]ADD06328.1 uncharacterized protein Nmag_2773 [Natrialba magadii ATCC 43099]ELY31237.1 hypothetical protein C500_06536 [Natrialba magadii ATCC 43099]
MNRHELIDVATISMSGLLLRNSRFFSQSVSSAPIGDVVSDTTIDIENIRTGGVQDVSASTPIGEFQAAYLVSQWRGRDAPTLLYHHGSGEQPFDFGRFSSNSFQRLFETNFDSNLNLIALRAPFHDRSNREYIRAMNDLENFVGMLATSASLIEALTGRLRDTGCPAILAAGISLGGWAVNLHRAYYGGVDRYVPIFAGANLGDMFVSSIYRNVTAVSARTNPAVLRTALDFADAFTSNDADNCDPLLARYDRIIEFETQRSAYEGRTLGILEKGHVTGSLATDALRTHIQRSVAKTRA